MGMNKSQVAVVCDAGPLIHLDEIACLDLLTDFQPIFVPKQVCQEVATHRPTALSKITLQQINVKISTEPSFQAMVQSLSLDMGEQAALSLMKQYPEAIFLTDDTAARLAGQTSGYRVHGTIGIILRSIRRQQRSKTEVLTILETLPQKSTLHIRPAFLQTVISQLRKE